MVADRSFPNGSPVCDYWLGHCEGFAVRAGHRTLGVVERVDRGAGVGLVETIVLRARRRRSALDTSDVLAVVPARKVIIARRHEHPRPAMGGAWNGIRRGYVLSAPVVRRAAAWLKRHLVRLARLMAAEIRERNRQHVAPGIGRAHRAANRYRFALSNPTRGARTWARRASRSSARARASAPGR